MTLKCPFGISSAVSIFLFTSLSQLYSQTELIVNGGFESGSTGWTVSGGADVYTDTGYARTGTGFLWLGGAVSEIDYAYQTITIPATATSASLLFYYNIISQEGFSFAYDTFSATIRNTSGTILATVGNWSNVNQDSGIGPSNYHQKSFNLLPYAGQTIRIQFDSSNDSSLYTSFYVDDVSAQVTISSAPPPNDTCSGAIAMTAGTTYTLNTAAATSTGDPTPVCQPSFGKGVWYSFTPSSSGNVTVSTCGSDYDTVLAVYTGSCGALTQVACNDNSGPACNTSQASATFAVTSGTVYLIMAGGYGGATGNLNILATGPGGLKIIPTFASSITSDPQAATIEATINSAIAVYQGNFSDPITVAITFQEMGSGLGLSSSYYQTVTYSSYRAALMSHATTADDSTTLAHLPNAAGNPVNGSQNVNVRLPLLRALGYSNADPPPGQSDGTISLNTSIMNLSSTTTNLSKYSLFATVSHEIDEVLGFSSALNGLNNGDPSPAGAISPEDLFRYDGTGARSFDTGVNTASYFSLDGTTDLARFNQHQGGDFHDWYSFYGGQTPQVQDAYSPPGVFPVLGVELTVLDVIGFTRVISITRPTLSLSRMGTNAVITWPSSFTGFTLQGATNLTPTVFWTTVLPSNPGIVNGFFTVTNSFTNRARFYRLAK